MDSPQNQLRSWKAQEFVSELASLDRLIRARAFTGKSLIVQATHCVKSLLVLHETIQAVLSESS